MFEHIRNPTVLLNRIHSWLYPDALLFIQVFSHRNFPQFFNRGNSSWMADNFFSGGIMPYDGYYAGIESRLRLLKTWTIPGMNYHKTLEFWLNNLRKNRTKILADGPNFVGGKPFSRYVNKYRVFLIFCSELFRFNGGTDWHLMHYLFQKWLYLSVEYRNCWGRNFWNISCVQFASWPPSNSIWTRACNRRTC